MRTIRVGSRESALAVAQSMLVINSIKEFDPTINVELVTMSTTGDRILDKSLDKIGGKGLFVKELDTALLENKVDITVHSFKDMPNEINPDLPIVAVSKREDPRDVMILPLTKCDPSLPIGCSSNRRMVQLEAAGFENFAPVRGNVLTRLKKLDNHEYRALILAAAGIKRLNLEQRISKVFEVNEIIPSACQGIIAVQARKGENTDFLSLFHSQESFIVSQAERAFIAKLNGGCTSPVAAFAKICEEKVHLTGIYIEEKSNKIIKGSLSGEFEKASEIGARLAYILKDGGVDYEG